MSARIRRPLASVVAACVVPVFGAVLFLSVVNGSLGKDSTFVAIAILMIIGYTTVGALIASRGARGVIGWLMMAIGIGFLLSAGTSEYAVYAYRTHPGGLPFGEVAAWLNNWLFLPSVIPVILVLLLFPTGTVPSRRWRFLLVAILAAGTLGILGSILRVGELDVGEGLHIQNPTAVPALSGAAAVALTIAGVGLIGAAIATVASLVLRYRRARGDERQQIRWLAYVAAVGAVFFVAALIASIGLGPNRTSPLSDAMFYAFFVCMGLGIPAAAGVAILRYRLWDLDVVIKKAVIATILVGTITGLSLLALAFVSTLFVGLSGPTTTFLLLGVAIGIASWPLRRFAGRVADRVVYGGRATPYEVLTQFSGRLADTYSTDDVVPRMAAILGTGTGARRVTIWLRVGRDLRPVASWPEGEGITDEGASWFEVRHQGEALGAITVSMPPNDPMTPNKERLVHDLAAQAGLVLRNVRLIEELRESRRRIVGAQDARARALERNIHDGAQQQLVALAVKLRLAESMLDRDAARAHEMLAQVQSDTQDALETLRNLARGIYPPLLADRGLPAALRAQAAKSTIRVEVSSDGVGRYGEDVEAAVYFCALEALQNVAKYAQASRVDMTLAAENGRLRFDIRDDGVGFDPVAVTRGTGLQGMTDRIEAIGGRLDIESAPGRGTRVMGTVPIAGGQAEASDPSEAADVPGAAAASQADTSRSGPNTALGM